MKTSNRSMQVWLAEIGSRATLAVAEENGYMHAPARMTPIIRRAREAVGRARGRARAGEAS